MFPYMLKLAFSDTAEKCVFCYLFSIYRVIFFVIFWSSVELYFELSSELSFEHIMAV